MFSIKVDFPVPVLPIIYMGSPVLLCDAEQFADIPVIGDGEEGDPVRIVVGFAHGFIITTGQGSGKGGIGDYIGKVYSEPEQWGRINYKT